MLAKLWDTIVVGAGIIGLATAVELARRRPGGRILVLEKEPSPGRHQSGRNSGVIHSGLYYRPGSLKARTCREGARRMVVFAEEHGIPYRLCGKVVVATRDAELPRLEELHRRGEANGVPDLRMIGPEELREIEPRAAGVRALHVPSAGIIDYSAVVDTLAGVLTAEGHEVRLGARVTGIRTDTDRLVVETTDGEYAGAFLINCAGLHADRVARLAGAEVPLRIVPFRGEYYELLPERRSLVRALIYPVPDPAFPFLGVHFTRSIDGAVEAGPNAVLALAREGYSKTDTRLGDLVDTLGYPGFWRLARRHWRMGLGEVHRSFSKSAFTRALQRLMPEIREEDLGRGGSGVRAQAVDRQGALLDDFAILRTSSAIHVCNAPSPGATASLTIAEQIVDMAERTN